MNLSLFMILPPVVFIIILLFMLLLSFITGKISYKSTDNPEGKTKAYACGEDVKNHRVKPNYSEFFLHFLYDNACYCTHDSHLSGKNN